MLFLVTSQVEEEQVILFLVTSQGEEEQVMLFLVTSQGEEEQMLGLFNHLIRRKTCD